MSKKYTVAELKKICKEKGIKGYGKLKKEQLMKHCLKEKTPAKKTPVKKTPAKKTPVKKSPSVKSIVKKMPKDLKGIIKGMVKDVEITDEKRETLYNVIYTYKQNKSANVKRLVNYIIKLTRKKGYGKDIIPELKPLMEKAKVQDITPEKLYKIITNVLLEDKTTFRAFTMTDEYWNIIDNISQRYEGNDIVGFKNLTTEKERKQFIRNRSSKGRKSWRALSMDDLEPLREAAAKLERHPRLVEVRRTAFII